jgi:hypothetical protein
MSKIKDETKYYFIIQFNWSVYSYLFYWHTRDSSLLTIPGLFYKSGPRHPFPNDHWRRFYPYPLQVLPQFRLHPLHSPLSLQSDRGNSCLKQKKGKQRLDVVNALPTFFLCMRLVILIPKFGGGMVHKKNIFTKSFTLRIQHSECCVLSLRKR